MAIKWITETDVLPEEKPSKPSRPVLDTPEIKEDLGGIRWIGEKGKAQQPEAPDETAVPTEAKSMAARTSTPESVPEGYNIELYKTIRPYLKELLTGIGLGGGAAVGTAASPGWGTLTGGGLGYAGGAEILDLLDKAIGYSKVKPLPEELLQSGGDVITGAAMTAAGEGISKAIGGAMKAGQWVAGKVLPSMTGKELEKRVGKELLDTLGTDLTQEQVKRNIEIAKTLEKKIPGLKFTFGQITNDAQAMSLQRALTSSGTKVARGRLKISGAQLDQEQKAFAEKALQDYYARKVAGTGKAEKYIDVVSKGREKLKTSVEALKKSVRQQVDRLSKIADEQELSKRIIGQIKGAKQGLKTRASELYDKIPNVKIPSGKLQEALKKVQDDIDPGFESAKDYPGRIIKSIMKKISKPADKSKILDASGRPIIREGQKTKDISFKQLRKLRTQLREEIKTASRAADPNERLIRRLKMIQEGVEDTIDSLKNRKDKAGELYRQASKYYREYAEKFKQGTIAEVLRKGQHGEETRIAMANIAGKFFTKDGIDDFFRAVGDDKIATDAIRDYARFQMYNRAYNPLKEEINTSRAFSWIHKYGKILDKLGIKKELLEIANKKRSLDVSREAFDAFNNSVAGRILKASPEKVVEQAFRGSSNYAETAKQLLKLAKGNKAAEQGIKKAVVEHILDASKLTSEGFLTDFKVSLPKILKKIQQFSPALRVLFKDEPEKLKALLDVRRGYQILNRTASSPIGGGSDTAEKLSNVGAAVAGARAGRYYLIVNLKKMLTRYADEQINEYLLRALYDPDYAVNLINLAKKQATKKSLAEFSRLMGYITAWQGKKLTGGQDAGKNKEG